MIFQLCLVFFVSSAAIFESSDGKSDGLDINYKASLHVGGERGAASIVDSEGGKRRQKRSAVTILDGTSRQNVVSVFNRQRSLVGASNMNYVGWNYDFEDAAINWTSACNYDVDFKPPFTGYVIEAQSATDYSSAQVVQAIFNRTDYYYAMRSTYVTGICAVKSSCSPITVNGAQKPQGYLYIIILPYASGFNETVPQYTLGPACSNCSTGISWCYNNLCSEKCDFNTTGCCQITASKAIGVCVTPPPTTPTSTAPTSTKPTSTTPTSTTPTSTTRTSTTPTSTTPTSTTPTSTTPTSATPTSATPISTTLTRSVSCCINALKFEIMLLGLMSILFAVIW